VPNCHASALLSRQKSLRMTDRNNRTLSGYNPLTETILSASVIFRFRDDLPGLDTPPDGTEFVTIDLGGAFFLGPTEVTTVLTPVGGPVLGSALVNLDADGILSYTIHWISGDFFAVSANLDAVSGPRAPAPVPDGQELAIVACAMPSSSWACALGSTCPRGRGHATQSQLIGPGRIAIQRCGSPHSLVLRPTYSGLCSPPFSEERSDQNGGEHRPRLRGRSTR
jgi:hypothetical protein